MNRQENIGTHVKALRSKLGLTQEEFAANLGVTFATVNRWENGRTKPSPLAMQQIAALTASIKPITQANPPKRSPHD